MKRTRNVVVFIFAFFTCTAHAQTGTAKPPFYDDVQTIKAYDRMFAPVKDPIVFVGSSSIRKWDDLQVSFGSYNVLNRGIGGSVIDNIIYYANELIFAYKPRQIVLYVGENDLAGSAVDTILAKTKRLVELIRSRLPEVAIVYISLKPSPSRSDNLEKCRQVNQLLKEYIATEKNIDYVDVFTPMLKDGKPMPELFVSDMLHMNAKGYAIWEKRVKPKLLKASR
jgi:lysophospholipase L1-like esterase